MDRALQTQLANIEQRTGKSVAQLVQLVKASGLTKHGQVRDMLKQDLGMGHGDANTIVHVAFESAASTAPAAAEAGADPADAIYTGAKAGLRPIHERVMEALAKLGPYEVAPKRAYVSLRRKKQFAMLGPATNSRVELGLNMKGVPATERLLAEPPGRMCQYKVKLTDPDEVDAELLAWARTAYDAAG